MRELNATITMHIPINYGEPDRNGNIYTKEAIENAVKNANNLPLLTEDDTVIGVVKSMQMYEDGVTVLANVFAAGTCEDIESFEVNGENVAVINNFRITAVGLGR